MTAPRCAAPNDRQEGTTRAMAKLKIDKDVIRELADLLRETGLSEIEWSEGDVLVRIGRETAGAGVLMPAGAMAAPAPAAAPVAAAPVAAEPEDLSSHPGAVVSPMVGTAYVAAEPGLAPFVSVGTTVAEGDTVIIVEAMKTMNPIPAPRGGTVTKILVDNEQPVEFGQVLLLIE